MNEMSELTQRLRRYRVHSPHGGLLERFVIPFQPPEHITKSMQAPFVDVTLREVHPDVIQSFRGLVKMTHKWALQTSGPKLCLFFFCPESRH